MKWVSSKLGYVLPIASSYLQLLDGLFHFDNRPTSGDPQNESPGASSEAFSGGSLQRKLHRTQAMHPYGKGSTSTLW